MATLERLQRPRRSRPATIQTITLDCWGPSHGSPQLRITKAGDRETRRLLVISANYILGCFGPDCDLRRFGLKIAERGGKNARKRAKVAVARKLAVLLHHLWTTGEAYDPFHLARRRGESVPA